MPTGKEHQSRGIFEQMRGAVKEGWGALTGNRSKELEGKAERAKGSIRETYGDIKSNVDREDPTKPRP